MVELKTLKDFTLEDREINRGEGILCCPSNLRKEAIKWYHRSDGNKHKFIKEFFNLTEDAISESSEVKKWIEK